MAPQITPRLAPSTFSDMLWRMWWIAVLVPSVAAALVGGVYIGLKMPQWADDDDEHTEEELGDEDHLLGHRSTPKP
jgi:hypothetical protein